MTDMITIREKGFRSLHESLGSVDTIRFIRQFENGYGDYTKEREKLFENLTIDSIVTSINARKKKKISDAEQKHDNISGTDYQFPVEYNVLLQVTDNSI
ncbi:hypothetical protein FACS1894200_08470 [Spirochaetia bacterium]|nr:hypothetical protein FACS1894200_08470 [Spirochaetia bacterium]